MTPFHEPNVLNHVSGPGTAWSTVNAAENIPGVMTPFGFDFWMNAVDPGVRGAFRWIGVLPSSAVRLGPTPDDRFGALFFGRFAGNVDQFRYVADLTPGTSGATFERDVFGSDRPDSPATRSYVRYPIVAFKAPTVFARLPRLIPARSKETRAWWQEVTGPGADCRPPTTRVREALDHLTEALVVHTTVTMLALGVFDQLGRLADRAGHPGLHLRIASGFGGMEETRMVSALYEIAQHPERESTGIRDFLLRYGARCDGENEISARSWREQPERIEKLIEQYRKAPTRTDPLTQHQQKSAQRMEAEQTLLAALPRRHQALARLLFRLGRVYIPLREEGKHLMAMSMDAGRCAARDRGRELVAAGVVDHPDDVFLLTLTEALENPPGSARELVADRKALRARYEEMNVPQFWIGNPEPVFPEEEQSTRVESIAGIAAAHGVAEGVARVVHRAEDCDEMKPDEILVCRTTDPSWAVAFHLASAVVIDIGGNASHAAIVSREMGLPSVVNTQTGTRDIRTGDLLRVDGYTGLVTILASAAAG